MTSTPQSNSMQEEALQRLILDTDLERLEDLLADFNLFDVLGIARGEALHSAFLAWLLNPRGSHGLQDYFLRRFLSAAAVEARQGGIQTPTLFDVEGWGFNDVEVFTERHNIDILLIGRSDGFVCLIENKVNIGEHSNQLRRYLDTVKEEYMSLRPFPIFLTPDGRKPGSETGMAKCYVPLGYQKVHELIRHVLEMRGSTISPDVHSFLEQYTSTLRRRVLTSNVGDNINQLALRIYNKHRDAIEHIYKVRSDNAEYEQTEALKLVEYTVGEYAPDLTFYYRRDKIECAYRSAALKNIRELTEEGVSFGCLLLFKFRVQPVPPHMILEMGPGPQETRKRIHQRTQRDKHIPPFSTINNLTPQWTRLYRRDLLSKQDFNPFDPQKAEPKVEQVIRDFYENHYWPMVNAIREEFGLPPAKEGSNLGTSKMEGEGKSPCTPLHSRFA